MTTLYRHPSPRQRHRQGNTRIVMLLLWGGLLWVGTLFFLLLPPLYRTHATSGMQWPAWLDTQQSTAVVAVAPLLSLLSGALLIAHRRGARVPTWGPIIPALLLFGLLWWVA